MIGRSAGSWKQRVLLASLSIYWLALVVSTHWPSPPQIGDLDKPVHFSAYALLGFLAFLGVFWGRAVRWQHVALLFLGLTLWGGIDELTQPPFGRTADWNDWFAD